MPTLPKYLTDLLDPKTGLPKGASRPAPQGQTIFGEPKNEAPFTNPILPGTTTSAPTPPGSSGASYPGSTTIPGFTPDYAALLASDPLLGQTRADLSAQGVTDAASRNQLINRALVQFGAIPDLGKAQQALGLDLGDLIDQGTAGLASQNQFSTEASLNKAHTDAVRQIRRALAARGALRSGELGYQLGEENRNFGQAQNDATEGLLDKLGGYQSAYAEGQRQAAATLRQAQQEAALRQAQLHPPTGSQTAPLAFVDADGRAVYRGPDGKLYDVNGNPYSGPGQAAAESRAITGNSQVPGYGPGVTNNNLASFLFGNPYGDLAGLG